MMISPIDTREQAAGTEQANVHSSSMCNTLTHLQVEPPIADPTHNHHPSKVQKPGIPAQQMQRTGTRERACGSGTGQNPLAEHAQHAPQPRSIAWGGGGEAAMKGGAPCLLRESFVPAGSCDVVTVYW